MIEINDEIYTLDMIKHLVRQKVFSEKTFGPNFNYKGIIDHIKSELVEIEENPTDITEWIDVIILAFDGAWRAGYSPEEILTVYLNKQSKNEKRQWPDWRDCDPTKAIEHID